MTDDVFLRPIREDDLSFLQGLIDDADETAFMWQGFRDPREWRQRWEAGRSLIRDGGGVVLVVSGEAPAGFISWDEHQWFGRPCWSLGIQLHPQMHGRGIGTRAHQRLVRYLFAQTVVNRIEAYTDSANIAERKALEKSGFLLEGTLRGACFRAGEWRDGVLYSIVRQQQSGTHTG